MPPRPASPSAIPAAIASITEGDLNFSLEEKSSCIIFRDVNSSVKAARLSRHWRSFDHGSPTLFQLGPVRKSSNGSISSRQTRFQRSSKNQLVWEDLDSWRRPMTSSFHRAFHRPVIDESKVETRNQRSGQKADIANTRRHQGSSTPGSCVHGRMFG